jgi:hypothetical protein
MVEKYFYYHPEALMSELQPTLLSCLSSVTPQAAYVGIRLFPA